MTFYAGLATVASRLLQDKGQNITFSRETGGTFNPDTGEETGASTTQYTGYGAAFDYRESEIDGELIHAGDIRLILEVTATAPEIGDTCPIDSVTHRVMDVRPLSPAGTVTMYTLRLRK